MATIVVGDFEWDDRKAESNRRKHGVSFAEAVTAPEDRDAITGPDLVEPSRLVTIGMSRVLRVLFVVHTDHWRSGRVRLISARKVSANQRRIYEEG